MEDVIFEKFQSLSEAYGFSKILDYAFDKLSPTLKQFNRKFKSDSTELTLNSLRRHSKEISDSQFDMKSVF